MLLHHKLEKALQLWIEANKGAALEGVHIVAAHATVEPSLPCLGIWCERAQPHPDFPGFGRGYPKLCPVVFEFRHCAEDALAEEEEAGPVDAETGQVHAATIAAWIQELDALLAGEAGDYQGLRDALNIPTAGLDERAVTGLYITAIHPTDAASSLNGNQWGEVLALEVIGQDSDPV